MPNGPVTEFLARAEFPHAFCRVFRLLLTRKLRMSRIPCENSKSVPNQDSASPSDQRTIEANFTRSAPIRAKTFFRDSLLLCKHQYSRHNIPTNHDCAKARTSENFAITKKDVESHCYLIPESITQIDSQQRT